MTESIDIAMTPAEARAMPADCFAVVDVLRATTTIATLFGGGLLDLVVVDELDFARRRARAEGRILFGEVGGLPPPGFDHGNSPVEASTLAVAGCKALMFTTNGTTALCSLADVATVIAGAPANLSATTRRAARYLRVVVVCAGSERGTRFALDDFAAAGAIVRALSGACPEARIGDAARIAMELFQGPPDRMGRLLRESHHGKLLAAIGLGADVEFAASMDSSNAVPVVVESGPGWARLEDRTLQAG